jgi:hypothetical protein
MLDNKQLVDHVVELCEKKAAEIERTRAASGANSTSPQLETAK